MFLWWYLQQFKYVQITVQLTQYRAQNVVKKDENVCIPIYKDSKF